MVDPDFKQLTNKQDIFSKNVAHGLTQGQAARIAGYNSPDQSACSLMNQPHILQAIHKEREKKINGHLKNVAWTVIQQLMEDPEENSRVRLDAAKFAAGWKEAPTDEDSIQEKRLEDMSPNQLESFISAAGQKLEKVMKNMPISGNVEEVNAQKTEGPGIKDRKKSIKSDS